MGKELFVSHMNTHQRVTSRVEDFKKQVDRMEMEVFFLDSSQLPSPVTSVISKWNHEQGGPVGRDGGNPSVK